MKCRFCGKEITNSKCTDCGSENYEAGGRILYGKNDGDRCNCMMYITDKYLFIGRVADNYFKKQRVGRGFGLVGMIVADASSDAPKTYGYYPLNQIQKVIFPFLNTRIDDKEAVKLVMKNGKDVILIFDQPGAFDGTRKVRKTMVEKLRAAAVQFEDGSGKNHGSEYCVDPLVNADTFDRLRPKDWIPEKVPSKEPAPARSMSDAEKQKANEAMKLAAVMMKATAKKQEEATPKVERIPCETCGTFVLKGKKFCTGCGAPMEKREKKPVCDGCGALLEEGDKFCNECGAAVEQKPKPLICAQCGESLEEGDKFCNECGAAVEQKPKPPVCPNCGKLLKVGKKFCSACGTRVEPTRCPRCDEEIEAGDRFCDSCGYALR